MSTGPSPDDLNHQPRSMEPAFPASDLHAFDHSVLQSVRTILENSTAKDLWERAGQLKDKDPEIGKLYAALTPAALAESGRLDAPRRNPGIGILSQRWELFNLLYTRDTIARQIIVTFYLQYGLLCDLR